MIIQIGSEGKGDKAHTVHTKSGTSYDNLSSWYNELIWTIIKILFTGYVT